LATQIKVWEIKDKQLVTAPYSIFADFHKESELENWIVQNPDILGEDLLVILRQRDIPGVGRLDLLCMDSTGKLVVVELKRDLSPREAVAQALDYASWLDATSEGDLGIFVKEYLTRDLEEAFQEHFHTEPPEWVCQNHRILLVAARLDASAERIINYLAERAGLDINAVFISFAKLSDGQEILIRSVLVAEETAGRLHTAGKKRPSDAALMAMAGERNTVDLVNICRELKGVWREQRTDTADGSFRYWADKPDGGPKMVFGVNVAGGLNNPPHGQLDVWVRPDALSEVASVSENSIRQRLSKIVPPFKASVMDFVLRLKSLEEAKRLIEELKSLMTDHQ
jgi:hypothetical protein